MPVAVAWMNQHGRENWSSTSVEFVQIYDDDSEAKYKGKKKRDV